MTIQPDQLEQEGFHLLDKMDHDELIPFVQKAMKYKNRYSSTYNALVWLVLMVGMGGLLWYVYQKEIKWFHGMTAFFGGAFIPFLTIPIHEWIHMLAYKSVGAPKTEVYSNLKKFYFAAVADQFVVNRQEFTKIALAPFLILSLAFLIPLFIVSPLFQLGCLGALFAHVLTCSGDFALLSYFTHHKDKEVVTYDDVAAKLTYFYAR